MDAPARAPASLFLTRLFIKFSLCLFPCVLSANSAPTNINASNLTIAENSATGTVIGEFNATDPDGDTNITYSLAPPLPNDLNISLWLDASDPSTITHSNSAVSEWSDKSGNNRHATQSTEDKKPLYSSISNSIMFDGHNDYMSVSGFNPQGEFSIYVVFANTLWHEYRN